jgi:drug/metabolite transporter (DMT)-like permease
MKPDINYISISDSGWIRMKKISVSMAVLSAALFGMAAPLSKLLLVNFNYFLLAGILYLGAAAGLFPFAVSQMRVKIGRIDNKNIRRILGSILFGGIFGPVFLLLGLKIANAASVSLWLNLELVATAVLGWLFFKDNLDFPEWIGVGGAILAGVLITVHEGHSGILAAGFVSLACVSWGLDNHYTALIDAITPTQMTFLKGLGAGSINCVIGIFLSPKFPEFKILAGALVVGIFCYGLSIVLYVTAAQNLGASRSQILFSSAPFFGAFFSVLLLSERISWIQVVATLILAVSIAFLILQKHSHEHGHFETEHVHWHRHDDHHHSHDHASFGVSGGHSHLHKHRRTLHSHLHFPDLHHRHDHSEKDDLKPGGKADGE